MADLTVDVFVDDPPEYVVEVIDDDGTFNVEVALDGDYAVTVEVDDHSLSSLSDVDISGRSDGDAVLWDASAGEYVHGTAGVTDHGALSGLSDNDHPQYVLDAGDTMTGPLVESTSAATDAAQKVLVSGDTGFRMWIYGSGKIGWASFPDGAASAPRVTVIPWTESTVIHQAWTTFATDDSGITTGNVVAVQCGRGGQPTFVMQTHGGTRAAPTPTPSGATLGEVAFRGCLDTTAYGSSTPGEIAGWSGAAIRGYAVEAWSNVAPYAVGGALTFETVSRSNGLGRTAGMVLFDGGRLALDPATTGLAAVFGNFASQPPARLYVVSQAATETTLALRAKAAQSAKVIEVQTSAGTVVASVDASGLGAFAANTTVGGNVVLTTATIDTDGTLAANSDSLVASQKATKTYADTKLAKASNLSDLPNASTARTNLGLGSAATQASSAFDAAGAAAAAQAYAIARANHTGTQTASTISDFDTQVATTAILKSLIDAKGDTLVGTADNTITRVAVGSNGKVQKADSTQTTGTLWDYAVPVHGAPKNGSTTYYTIPGFSIINTTTSALVAGVVIYFPIYAATPITVDQLAIEQTGAAAAGKLMRFGIIAADKWWQPTGSALADSGNIAADGANGAKTYTPGSPLSLSGRYVGVVHSDGAPTLRAWVVAGPGVGLPTAFGANVVSYWRATKALGAITATAWDTVTTSVSAMQHLIALRVSEPAA